MYVCTGERVYGRMYACMYACMHVCTSVCMHVCMYLCVCMATRTYMDPLETIAKAAGSPFGVLLWVIEGHAGPT